MVYLLIDRILNLINDWLIALMRWWILYWLIDYWMDWLIYWFIDRWIDLLINLLIDWLIDWLIGRLIDGWIDGLMDWFIDWLIDWLIYWLIDWFRGSQEQVSLDVEKEINEAMSDTVKPKKNLQGIFFLFSSSYYQSFKWNGSLYNYPHFTYILTKWSVCKCS